MSIPVVFYSFAKKRNSTKVPVSGGNTYNCFLKDPCSISNPTIELNGGNKAAWNYCYIAAFDRYYFITDWVTDHDRWIAHCKCDVLASFKNTIINSTQYIIRAASRKNPYLQDPIYPMSTKRSFDSETISDIFSRSSAKYVIAVSNMDNTADSKINGVQYLILNSTQMAELTRVLLTEDYFGLGPTEALFGLTFPVIKSVCNPLSYIGEAYILPITPRQDDVVTVGGVSVGWWALTGYSGTRPAAIKSGADKILYSKTISLTINKHPQIGLTDRLYLNASPYVDRILYAGPFGTISLNDNIIAQMIGSNTSITLKGRIDVDFKGHAILYIYNENPYIIIDRRECDISIPIPLTQSKNELYKLGDAAISAGASIASGEIGTNLVGSVRDAVSSIVPTMQTIGNQGSMISIFEDWQLQVEYRYISEGETAVNISGSPLCEVLSLSELTGYVQTDAPFLDCAAYAGELDEIYNYMQGGFFIE